jgi:histidyl-tRNA synthetase
VVLAGETEIASQQVTLKNMATGEQKLLDINTLIEELR